PARMNRRLRSLRFGFISLAAFLSISFSAHAQQQLFIKLQSAYEAEANPVKRAKLLAKIGPLAVDEASKNLQNDQDEPAFKILERFRDDARKTTEALFAAQPDAIRHPAG